MAKVMGTSGELSAARRLELASYLKARRASLQPHDVGLDPPPRRRNTPGLRREEVALLSGVGVTWYTWLEQGRPVATSEPVIDALARTLLLDRESHGHLRRLAGLPLPDLDRLPERGVSCSIRGSLVSPEANPEGAERPEGRQLMTGPEAVGSSHHDRAARAR